MSLSNRYGGCDRRQGQNGRVQEWTWVSGRSPQERSAPVLDRSNAGGPAHVRALKRLPALSPCILHRERLPQHVREPRGVET